MVIKYQFGVHAWTCYVYISAS